MRQRARGAGRLVLCALAACATLAAAAEPTWLQRGDFFGVVTHYWGDVMPQKMRDLGAGWIRAGCQWADVQPAPSPDPGTWNWSCPDQTMSATGQGLHILYGLGYAPSWANGGNAGNVPPTPGHMSDWYHYCSELMARYRGRRVVYEVWNEPNIDLFFQGSLDDYVNLVRLASQALRAVDPSGRISGPESSNLPTPGRESWHRDAIRTLGSMLDVVTTHWYCGSRCGTVDEIDQAAGTFMAARTAEIPAGVPLWLTETGLQTPDDGRQVEFYEGVLRAYSRNFQPGRRAGRPPWQNVFFYHLLADDDNTLVRLDPNRTSRPAFDRYRWWIAGRPYAVPRTSS